jgi:glycosyltransferase involved in cell wall biosynthesis
MVGLPTLRHGAERHAPDANPVAAQAPDLPVRTRYSLIVPIYKNEETLVALIEVLRRLSADLDGRLEAVFVVDGSPDRSFAILREALGRAGLSAQLICLSRNFGSFAAIRMGLESAHGPFYAVLAADLQEPPELILAFFRALDGGDVDVVVGVRERREDPLLGSLSSRLFWAAYRRFIQPEVPPGGVDVFGCNRMVRDALLRMREANSSLVGLLFWLGFRRRNIPYARQARAAGKSAWTFRRKFRYLLDSCFALTDLPINLMLGVGVLGLFASLVLSAVVFAAWLGGMIQVAGYTPLALLVLNAFMATTLALGVIGSYVWRTYENTKDRPLYVPMIHEVFEREPPE